MTLTFVEAAAEWVRRSYPGANPITDSVIFDVDNDYYTDGPMSRIKVSWLEDKPTTVGFNVIGVRPVPRYYARQIQLTRQLDPNTDLTTLISEITDLALEGSSGGEVRREIRQSE
jgi:hypothetical protein